MIKSTTELFQEVLEDTHDLVEYVLSSSGDPNLPKWLLDLKTKIAKLYGRAVSPITPQLPPNDDDYVFMSESEDI
jgi:hypothetical protein